VQEGCCNAMRIIRYEKYGSLVTQVSKSKPTFVLHTITHQTYLNNVLLFFICMVFATEKDPYPVDALPTCNHALNVCQQERKCIKLFEDFKLHCKVRENKCRMEDRLVIYDRIQFYFRVCW
jgi:hypothetical protein